MAAKKKSATVDDSLKSIRHQTEAVAGMLREWNAKPADAPTHTEITKLWAALFSVSHSLEELAEAIARKS